MATLAPFGFQAGQSRRSVNEYYVPASDTSQYAVGDVVKTNGNVFVGRLADSRVTQGMLHVAKAASGDAVRGVVVGIAAGPGGNNDQSVPTTKTRAYTLLVNDNPQALWDIQADNTTALSVMTGMYANYTVGAPTGSVSSTRVSSSTIGTTIRDLLIAEVLSNTGANSLLRVAFVRHEMAAAGGSPSSAGAVQALVSADGNSGRSAPMLSALSSAIGVWSHTRATANASVVDCYGSMQFALSGERRFRGARRVCNVIGDTEGLTTAWTLGANTSKAAAPYRSPNHSRPSAWTLTRSSGASNMITRFGVSYRPGKWCWSMWIRGNGVQTYTLAIGATTQTVTPPAGVWTRCAVTADIASTAGVDIYVTNATSGAATLTMCDPQMEWVHGQDSPAPGEYVPRGVAGFPAALLTAGVDGVRYFETSNPWVLSSGIATRTAVVTPIDPSLMLGMQFSPISTNQVFDSRDISQATWSKTGSTTVNATPTDSTLLGKNSLFKLQEAATSSGYRVTQSWRGTNPAANAALSVSFYCKAAERSIAYIGLRQLDGATFTYAYFDLVSGTVSNVTAGCTAYMYREGDLWRVCFTGPAGSSGSTAPLIQVGMTTTAGTQTYTGTLNSGLWVGAVQFEEHGCPTSYIGDTGSSATLTRNADSTSVTLIDCPGIDHTIAFDYTPFFPTDTPWKDSWWYILSAYVNGQDRNAMGLRPNAFGGAGSGMEDEWFFDLYPNVAPAASSWDGVEIKTGAVVRAGETVTVQWSLASDGRTSGTSSAAGDGTTNQTARVGNVAATLTGDTPRPTINALGSVPRTYWVGKQGEFLAQRGEFCLRNLKWQRVALTAAQMAEVSP